MKLALALALMVILGFLFLSRRHVGYPFAGPGYDPAQGVTLEVGKEVFVAVTEGQYDKGQGKIFLRQLRQVMDSMPENPGLVGFAVRKQILGRKVWTLSVWKDEASLSHFLRNQAHRQAVSEGGIPPSTFRSAYTHVSPEEIPFSWQEAVALLETAP
ncbi:MAG: antibiotic biosynthesis monooxygenase [Verrucomicrobiota bacterium]